jgi:beta-glucosidase
MNRATFLRLLLAQAGALVLAQAGPLVAVRASAQPAGPAGSRQPPAAPAPRIEARAKPLLTVDGLTFKDLNGNGQLDPYEDWRRPVAERVEDLVCRMTLVEKAGMMLIDTLNAGPAGALSVTATQYVGGEHMTRFIFRNPVVPSPDPQASSARSGPQITPRQAATFTNRVQELAEGTRLGIPVVFKSNARNHYEQDARPGINVGAGSFSEWPKEAGLAATRDMDLIREFGSIMAQEWVSIGLRGMYGYMADLATEPRWFRVHETFTEDPELAAEIMAVLVPAIQGRELGPGGVALTIKHFPGGGPAEGGADPHYTYGKRQVYPLGAFDRHVKPFRAAIEAGASAIMTYYGIPVEQRYLPNNVGMAFSKGIVTDLLRGELGFTGYVNSDTGIIGTRAWGLEHLPVTEQIAVAVDAGTDVLSGFHDHKQIVGLVESGRLSEARLDQSVHRLLVEQFRLGLFENPYVDPEAAERIVGNPGFRAKAELAQRRSIVLLQNTAPPGGRAGLLPLAATKPDGTPIRLYTMGLGAEAVRSSGFTVTAGDHEAGQRLPPVPADTDAAIIRVTITNPVMPAPGENPPQTIFGGATPDELDFLSFSQMAASKSWIITPSLLDIQAVMEAVGSERTVLAIYFRQPYVLDEASGLRRAGALLSLHGASDAAVMDVITGRFKPQGKLPFALANSVEAIRRQASDTPGYAPEDTLYPFGFGLSY